MAGSASFPKGRRRSKATKKKQKSTLEKKLEEERERARPD